MFWVFVLFCFVLFCFVFKNFNTFQISVPGSCQPLDCQTWGQGLLQFLCLLFACDDQGQRVSAASNFKLHIILIFLDLDRFGILSPGYERKALDFFNFVRHGYEGHRGACGWHSKWQEARMLCYSSQ